MSHTVSEVPSPVSYRVGFLFVFPSVSGRIFFRNRFATPPPLPSHFLSYPDRFTMAKRPDTDHVNENIDNSLNINNNNENNRNENENNNTLPFDKNDHETSNTGKKALGQAEKAEDQSGNNSQKTQNTSEMMPTDFNTKTHSEGVHERQTHGERHEPETHSDENQQPVPAFLPPQHPLLQRLQKALQEELETRKTQLNTLIQEKKTQLDMKKKERDEIGVALYHAQQSLADGQEKLEEIQSKYKEANARRKVAEQQVQKANEAYEHHASQKAEAEQRQEVARKEVEQLYAAMREIEVHNEKTESDIKTVQRATYGTEKSMVEIEKSKTSQDLLIDQLHEKIKDIEENIKYTEQQIIAQSAETERAKTTLAEAEVEMQKIQAEKKEYLLRWQTCVFGMQKRDSALQSAEATLREQREKLQNMNIELIGYSNAIRNEQRQNERLTAVLGRVESETRFVDQQLEAITESRQKLQMHYSYLIETLERTDTDLKFAVQTQNSLKNELERLHKASERVAQEKQQIQDIIFESLNSKTTLEKGAHNVFKQTAKLRQDMRNKEIELGDINNEIARIKFDTLNTNAHNKELKLMLEQYDHELKEKEQLVERYELEIRQRHDKIEKKQVYIVRLNRKLEQMNANHEEENTGPLESTISHLQKEIAAINREVNEYQREWLKTQTQLVALAGETETLRASVKELAARETVLRQKRVRLQSSLHQQKNEMKDIDVSVRSMQTALVKLNELIGSNAQLQADLTNQTYTMEMEYMVKLKAAEAESKQQEANIARLKEEKNALFNELVDSEKQLMLWEKKISLEKETQEALDPHYGQSEIQAMKKEIHRMQLNLAGLKREQEKTVAEMERTIAKRENIRLSSGNHLLSTKQHSKLNAATLKQQVNQLKIQFQKGIRDAKRVANEAAQQEEKNSQLNQELEKQQKELSDLEEHLHDLNIQEEDLDFRKQITLEVTIMQQKRAKRYEDALQGRYKPLGDREKLLSDLHKQEEKLEKLKDAMQRFSQDHPGLQSWFDRLQSYA